MKHHIASRHQPGKPVLAPWGEPAAMKRARLLAQTTCRHQSIPRQSHLRRGAFTWCGRSSTSTTLLIVDDIAQVTCATCVKAFRRLKDDV